MDLHLSVKGEYFDQLKAGTKPFEFRAKTPYWKKRIEGRNYNNIIITHGYPKRDDASKRLKFPWRGYEDQTITHKHFSNVPTEVYAIKIQQPHKED